MHHHEAAHAAAHVCLSQETKVDRIEVGSELNDLIPGANDMIASGRVEVSGIDDICYSWISTVCSLAGVAHDHVKGYSYLQKPGKPRAVELAAHGRFDKVESLYPRISGDLIKAKIVAVYYEREDSESDSLQNGPFAKGWRLAKEFVRNVMPAINELARNHLSAGGTPGNVVREVLTRHQVVKEYKSEMGINK